MKDKIKISGKLETSKTGSVLVITINNRRRKNALSLQMYQDLTNLLNGANKDGSVNVVVLTGKGDFYSSGNELDGNMKSEDSLDVHLVKSMKILHSMVESFYKFSKLLIAVVNGPCIGIAATTLALCDVVYASETAYFYTPFTKMGLCAEGCSSYTFPRILGRSKASEMLMLNHKMSAQEALKFNFISSIYKKDELKSKIWPRIEEISELPIGSVKICKQLVKKFEIEELEKANANEIEALSERWMTEDAMNAIMSFMTRKSKI